MTMVRVGWVNPTGCNPPKTDTGGFRGLAADPAGKSLSRAREGQCGIQSEAATPALL